MTPYDDKGLPALIQSMQGLLQPQPSASYLYTPPPITAPTVAVPGAATTNYWGGTPPGAMPPIYNSSNYGYGTQPPPAPTGTTTTTPAAPAAPAAPATATTASAAPAYDPNLIVSGVDYTDPYGMTLPRTYGPTWDNVGGGSTFNEQRRMDADPSAWRNQTPEYKAAYFADNPGMAKVQEGFLDAWGMTLPGMAQNAFDPGQMQTQRDILARAAEGLQLKNALEAGAGPVGTQIQRNAFDVGSTGSTFNDMYKPTPTAEAAPAGDNTANPVTGYSIGPAGDNTANPISGYSFGPAALQTNTSPQALDPQQRAALAAATPLNIGEGTPTAGLVYGGEKRGWYAPLGGAGQSESGLSGTSDSSGLGGTAYGSVDPSYRGGSEAAKGGLLHSRYAAGGGYLTHGRFDQRYADGGIVNLVRQNPWLLS